MKNKVKLMTDILMTILFIVMMGYHHTGAVLHEWFGIGLFILFLLHNFLNMKWYSTLLKGKYAKQRIVRLIINIALLIAFLSAFISGVMMSKYVFGFLNLKTTMFARRLHMLSTSWSFLLMAVHFGLHWSMVVSFIKKCHIKNKILIPLEMICIGIGCYVFVQKEYWNELFLLVDFVFLNYQESNLTFFIKQTILMAPFIFIGYQAIKCKRGR